MKTPRTKVSRPPNRPKAATTQPAATKAPPRPSDAGKAPAGDVARASAAAAAVAPGQVVLAAVIGAHGVGGEVKLKVFAEQIEAHRSFNDGALTIVSLRNNIARFAEVTDRNAAEAMRGTLLTVPRAALPALDEGEYYHADLIGLSAVSTAGDALGQVVAVENFGAGDVVEVERPSEDGRPGKRFMVPMSAVPEWDEQRLVIDAAFVE
jgi:16S rRNA processing protein RimM